MPLARRSATTTSTPPFSMVRRPRVDTRKLKKRFSVSDQKRCVCKFGRKRRRLRLFAWDTVFPVFGALPVTWQTRDMAYLRTQESWNSRALYQGALRQARLRTFNALNQCVRGAGATYYGLRAHGAFSPPAGRCSRRKASVSCNKVSRSLTALN